MLNFKPQFLEMPALRAEAQRTLDGVANSMEASAISKRRDEAALAYVELTLTDKLELIGVGDSITYHRASYGCLEGTVTALCEKTSRALVRFDDGFGEREVWMSIDYLELNTKAAAR